MFVPSLIRHRVTFGAKRAFLSCFPMKSVSMKRKRSNSSEVQTSKRPNMVTATIALTSREAQLRDLLLDVASYINKSKDIKEPIELRFAGGWVRDKLLSIPSHDIDTAINAMTGSAFTEKMTEYLNDEENLKKHSLEPNDINNLHTIQANPDKSKHLETVTTTIFDFDVDFVNLRKEIYADDSRNPQMVFGTALEDAQRRDATINALFYNLRTGEVEDFVGGLEDLEKKRIRTPMDPEKTFKDDPLRVLRLIRFASRLGFTIDPKTKDWMGDPTVLADFKRKISRERVGTELEKMLKGNDPRSSLEYIDELGLYSTIFTDSDPKARDVPVPDTGNWRYVYTILNTLKNNTASYSIYQSFVRSEEAKYVSWILAALVPWVAIPNPEGNPGAKAPPTFGKRVAQHGIMANSHICRLVNDAFKNYKEIIRFKTALVNNETWTQDRSVGMRLREWQFTGGKENGNWRIQALFALLVEVMNRHESHEIVEAAVIAEWQRFIDKLEELDVMDAPSIRPLVDGDFMKSQLGVEKGGPWMAEAMNICMAYQLQHPSVTDPQEIFRSLKDEILEVFQEQMQAAMTANVARIRAGKK